jgi:hypothetical protein
VDEKTIIILLTNTIDFCTVTLEEKQEVIYSMKKLFVLAVIALAALTIRSQALATEPTIQVGIVQGLISGPDNSALVGADVDVLCNGITKSTNSDGAGFYSVQYVNEGCEVGDTATVTASKDGQTGVASGTLQDGGQIGFLKLDLAVIHVPVVPEFGLITGGLALATSAGSYFLLKRKRA